MSSVGLGQSLSSNTNANLTTRFGSNSTQIAGVVSLNALAGNLAVVGDTSIGIINIGSGQLQVSTAGKPQVVASVTSSGAVVGATITSTGLMTCASAGVAGSLVAGSITAPNILPSQQVITSYATTPGSSFFFSQVGGIGTVIGQGVSNASGVIIVGLPAGRTGNCIGGSCTPAGNNTGGTAPMYGVTFLPTASTPPGPNQAAFGTIDRTSSSSQSGITAFVTACFVMSN